MRQTRYVVERLYYMIGYLVGFWLPATFAYKASLGNCLSGELFRQVNGYLNRWLAGWPYIYLVDSLWLAGCLISRLAYVVAGRQSGRLVLRLTSYIAGWLAGYVAVYLVLQPGNSIIGYKYVGSQEADWDWWLCEWLYICLADSGNYVVGCLYG